MKKTSREGTHSIPNPTHFKSSPVLSETEHWFSALWTGSVLVIVWCTQKNFRVKSVLYYMLSEKWFKCSLLLLSTRTNGWEVVHTFTYWSTLMSYCLEFINVPDYLHPFIFSIKMLACFLFGLCLIHVPFCSHSLLNNCRRIVQVLKPLTRYFMFLRSRNSFRPWVLSSEVDLSRCMKNFFKLRIRYHLHR
jgi:hypothetical protein